MIKIGLASIDITPKKAVWLVGYGNRDHKSAGVYLPLRAGAVSVRGTDDEALVLTADLIGYGQAYAATAHSSPRQWKWWSS